jgi:6-pyruvoyltetrahydropterin/6-carboxytetrahydropterin synthase
MGTISVKTHFAAGHRILGLTGPGAKCRNIHGHTFHVTWTFLQDTDDMKIEFGSAKAVLRQMIKELFDHGFIIDRADDFRTYLRAGNLKYYTIIGPPTTEAIAAEIAAITLKLMRGSALLSVEVQEGPENAATWTRGAPAREPFDTAGEYTVVAGGPK